MKRAVGALMLIAMQIAVVGCYRKYLILQAEVVSMTQSNAGDAKNLKIGKEVNVKWCSKDKLVYKSGDDKNVGLADQVIYKAQNGGKRADFITNVTIYGDSNGCALLTGKAAKL
jgi:hypothetical protein